MADRPARADAVRNRAAILAAARDRIAASGPAVGMDEIAAAAGVAVGTLYRHFPAKADLVAAIVDELGERLRGELAEAIERVEAGGSAYAEIADLIERVACEMDTDRALRDVAARLGADVGASVEHPARLALTTLVEAAHREGTLRADVTVDDLALVMGTLPDATRPPEARRRWVELVLRGLRF